MQRTVLSDICILKQYPALPKRNFTAEGYPVYGANGIIGHYTQYNHEQRVITITCRGDSCGTTCYTEPFSYITANAICLESLRQDILPKYLYYYLKQADFTPYITGAAQPQITQKSLGSMPIPLCSIKKQQFIINSLQKAEHILGIRHQQLQTLNRLKQAFYYRYMTTMPKCADTPYRKLAEVATIRCGKQNSGAASDTGKYPFFSCAKKPKRIESFSFDCECVLLTGNIDFQVQYFNGKFDAYQRTYIIESQDKEKLTVPYLHAFLEHYLPTLQQQAVGGVIKYIRRPMLSEASIPIPPLDEQEKIGNFSLKIQKMQREISLALDKETRLYEQLLNQLLKREN